MIDLPKEIIKALKDVWKTYLENAGYLNENISDNQIEQLEDDIIRGTQGYDILFALSDDIFGKTKEEKIKIWHEIIKGKYELYFQICPRVQEIIVNNQTFMI